MVRLWWCRFAMAGCWRVRRTVTVVDPNEPPVVVGDSMWSFAENGVAAVGEFTASDSEGDMVLWSLTGVDAALFRVAGRELRFLAPPDFEAPADYGADNVYDMIVEASDGAGIGRRTVAVTVTDLDETVAITIDTGGFVVDYDENSAADVAALTATDPEGAAIRWSLGGDDSGAFEISDRGVLRFLRPPDYERPVDHDGDSEYLVEVRARAGAGAAVAQGVVVNVVNVDEDGVLVLSSPQPQAVTPLRAAVADPDGGVLVLSWVWQRSQGGAWEDIVGAVSAAYTPTAADVGRGLRVEALYRDSVGATTDSAAAQAAYATRAAPSTANSAPDFGGGPHGALRRGELAAGRGRRGAGRRPATPTPATAPSWRTRCRAPTRISSPSTAPPARSASARAQSWTTRRRSRSYSVTVAAADPSGARDDIAVTVEVTDANEAPLPREDTAAAVEDTAATIAVLANDTDPDSDTLTAAVRDAPLHGRVTLQPDKTLLYTPHRDFNGNDIFTYTATDGRLSSETTVIVTVEPRSTTSPSSPPRRSRATSPTAPKPEHPSGPP